MTITVTPLTGTIGASVTGVELGKPISEAEFRTLHKAFLAHCMLVFRDQNVREGPLQDFARRWGEPTTTPMLKYLDGFPFVLRIDNPGKVKSTTENWHYDSSFSERPPKLSMLSARIIPVGGDTMWCNQYVAYERLSPALQKLLSGLRGHFIGTRIARFMGVDPKDIPPGRFHPIVRTHPETGRKALFVGHWETLTHFEGMTVAESRPLLDYLYEQSFVPDNIYRHHWQVGDLVMWDNRCTMHYAVHDYGDQPRELDRITLIGEVPA